MVNIDLLITKDNNEVTLSSQWVTVQDVDYSSASLDVNRRVVKGRSGYIHAGTRYDNKVIKAAGKIKVKDIMEYHQVKDHLNGLLVDETPYYVTPLMPSRESLYDFELPGENEGDVKFNDEHKFSIGYRFKVVCENGLDIAFLGKTNAGLLFNFSLEFITAELPFGETIPRNFDITSKQFLYKGTAKNSQLEYPWQLKLTSNANQSGKFTINLDGKVFQYDSNIQITPGDTFLIEATGTLKNGVNVSEYTNYEYLELRPLNGEMNSLLTEFKGKIEILDYIELYK